MNNMYKSKLFNRIFVVAYNNDFDQPFRTSMVYDGYQLDDLGFNEKQKEIALEYLQKTNDIELYATQDVYQVYTLEGNREQLVRHAEAMAKQIKEMLQDPGFGGDDVYFDYFPDHMYQFRQICSPLGLNKLYKDVIKAIQDSNQYLCRDMDMFDPDIEPDDS